MFNSITGKAQSVAQQADEMANLYVPKMVMLHDETIVPKTLAVTDTLKPLASRAAQDTVIVVKWAYGTATSETAQKFYVSCFAFCVKLALVAFVVVRLGYRHFFPVPAPIGFLEAAEVDAEESAVLDLQIGLDETRAKVQKAAELDAKAYEDAHAIVSEMSTKELRAEATKLQISGRSKMNTSDLVEAITEAIIA